MSSMVKVAVVEVEFPHESVAVKVTSLSPVSPHKSLNDAKLLLQITGPLQASVAAAPPLASNHAVKSAVLPVPSHSTVSLTAMTVIVGSVVSTMVNVAVVVLLLLLQSSTVKVTVTAPVAPQDSLNAERSLLQSRSVSSHSA